MDLLSKVFYTGVGATVAAAQVVEKLGEKVVFGANKSKAQGANVAVELIRQAQDVKDALEKVANDALDKALSARRD